MKINVLDMISILFKRLGKNWCVKGASFLLTVIIVVTVVLSCVCFEYNPGFPVILYIGAGVGCYFIVKWILMVTACKRGCSNYCSVKDICDNIKEKKRQDIEREIKEKQLDRDTYIREYIEKLKVQRENTVKFHGKRDKNSNITRELRRIDETIEIYESMLKK